jgi:glycosyltransferase involved in cell wall biosynthesis
MINKKIAILLSTYNGAQYIEEQIDSIIYQTNSNWILYIRDDGSTDKTIEIISKYQKLHSNIILLQNDKTNLGAKDSFLWLLKNIESDYFMFCDQDDVWLPNKIEFSFFELLKIESNLSHIPALVYTDLIVVNENLELISKSMWDYSRSNRIMNPEKYLFATPLVTGCTMIFNNQAKLTALKHTKNAVMHDALIALSVLISKGRMKAIHKQLIYYRQHGKNVLGAVVYNGSILNKIGNLKKIIINNYLYFKFVSTHEKKITILNYLLLKTEVALKIRNII